MAVLGAGNALLGDDGVGVAVAEALRSAGLERRLPGLTLVEAGTAAFEAVALLDEMVTRLVVVDAVEGGGPPGAVYRFDLEAIVAPPPWHGHPGRAARLEARATHTRGRVCHMRCPTSTSQCTR